MDSRNESTSYSVVMLPWLAHGHISPYLELAKRLAARNFHIYFCSTSINLDYIKKNLTQKYSQSIKLIELDLSSSADLHPHHHTTNGLPPHLIGTLRDAYQKSTPSFTTIVGNLRTHLLIYDFNAWWAADVASSFNIPCVLFLVFSAVFSSVVFHFSTKPSSQQYPFPEISLKDHERRRMIQTFGMVPFEDPKATAQHFESIKRSCGIILIRSVSELEGKYIHYMSQISDNKVLPVGPLTPKEDNHDEHTHIFHWLDLKKESSVIYLCFGSEYYLSDNEIQDIACGLELSNESFIWVIRFPEGTKTSLVQLLPSGFLERGMVIEKWAPQAQILSHASIGGFVSHCGTSSVLESIRYGIPIIAMPMQYDQPYNARLMEATGVGVDVGRDADGRLNREEFAIVVRNMVEKMESVFHISGCAVENQVKFATCTLLGAALTWRNGYVRTLGHDAAYTMTWEILKKKLTDKYCPKGETKKLEIELWNLKVKGNDVGGSGEKKPYGGSKPMCPKCNYHHNGECAPKCTNCKKVVHLTKDCWHPTNANNQRTITCYECGNQGHYKSDCLVLKNQGTEARGMVYALGGGEINQDLDNTEDDINA
nr:beta-D-glucosyl crocetin beta-1,6-glucosyltransferase-like [Tanacetum cinerariifolium]